jgi:RNA polymerase sigma-70 factor (ECF subfamily)
MQDSFMRTWAYVAAGNEIENLRAFLYKTARNLCVNEMVRGKTYSLDEMQEVAGFDPEETTIETPEDIAEASVLMQNIATLDDAFQEVLTLRYMNGLAVNEIGEILGEAPNTVSVRIHRAIQELKKRMHL